MEYNLTKEKWIPVITIDNEVYKHSIQDCLEQAHLIKEIYAETPLDTIALYRFLQAFVIRIFGFNFNKDLWYQFFHSRSFDKERIESYLKDYYDRFNIFDYEKPFYQKLVLPTEVVQHQSVLFNYGSKDRNDTLYNHKNILEERYVKPDELARALVSVQAFSKGGGASIPFNFSESNYMNGALFWIKGKNLYQSLVLNTPFIESMENNPKDVPAWEREEYIELERNRMPEGYLDYLTCQSKYIKLNIPIPYKISGITPNTNLRFASDEDSFNIYKTQGDKQSKDFRDPLKAYTEGKNGVYSFNYVSEKSLWRDSDILLKQFESDMVGSPQNLQWLAFLDEPIGKIEVEVFGILYPDSNKGSFKSWRHDVMPFYPNTLKDSIKNQFISKMLELSNEIMSFLRFSLKLYISHIKYPSSISEKGKLELNKNQNAEITQFIKSAKVEQNYWSRLEIPFYDVMERLSKANDDQISEIEQDWKKEIIRGAFSAFDDYGNSIDHNARTLKALSIARNYLSYKLYTAGEDHAE
jgi:CRISPR type I-E-associated protein CasA/Cse1